MDKTDISFGSKNPKKEINIEVTGRHIFLGFMFLLALVAGITALVNEYFGEIQNLELRCVNGTVEQIQFGKEYYCGEHYSVINGLVSNEKYQAIERQIFVGDLDGE